MKLQYASDLHVEQKVHSIIKQKLHNKVGGFIIQKRIIQCL